MLVINKTIPLLIAICICCSLQLKAQEDNCVKFSKANAIKAIQDKLPRIVIVGGVMRAARPGDDEFAEKYKIQFIDTGCVIESGNCIAEFNKITFAYLDKRYGKRWRKHIRQDLLGLGHNIPIK